MPGGVASHAAQGKHTRYAVLLVWQETPVAFQAFSYETALGFDSDASTLLKRLKGLLNQAIIALEDAEGYDAVCRVTSVIAIVVGRQLADLRV